MPYVSHRSGEARTFDCLYDPNYIVPSERDVLHATLNAADSAAPVHIYPKYEVMFENAPKETRLIFRKQQSLPTTPRPASGRVTFAQDAAAATAAVDCEVARLEGGANLANLPTNRKLQKVIASAGECKSKSPSSGLYLYRPCVTTDVNVVNVRLSDSQTKIQSAGSRLRARSATTGSHVDYQRCNFGVGEEMQPKRKRIISKTRGTQTLYRESSAQTLPYLPDVSNDKEFLEHLELFRLPTILPGDGPPGLYEVEVLERARKRWAFNKALKDNFERQLKEAREAAKRPELKPILEAFEWEHWIEREEYIQECQMIRLELLIRMFDKREREMHDASKDRLTKRCEQIEQKREKALKKNEIEFGRDMRRLEMRRRKMPRNWRKENICDQLGQPSSEFYAPQMRYGVNPNRRHFAGGRKAFEARMDDLEKQAISMGKLVCPYAKLKEWSKPKQQAQEFEQNFCSDDNLKKLYETMKNLRELSEKRRTTPKCLIEKFTQQTDEDTRESILTTMSDETAYDVTVIEIEKKKRKDPELERQMLYEEIRQEAQLKRQRVLFLLDEKRHEELDSMLADYEGSTIGWLMRFLTEEMDRLQEQRKLHFITMTAQRERWRREAAEAGLRQKENNMRHIYEQLYEDTTTANEEVARQYLDDILRVEIANYAEDTATNSILELARLIDEDIQHWLQSIHAIQTPLNFEALRYLLKNLIFPNAEFVLHRYEAEQSIRYIIEDVLLPRVECLLEPYDIATSLAEETVDRTIDNDLYYFSSQSESSLECDLCLSQVECECTPQKREAGALLRKLVRYVVPGRRWKTPNERITYENLSDILDDAFRQAICKGHLAEPVTSYPSHINLINSTPPNERLQILQENSTDSQENILHMNIIAVTEERQSVTHELQSSEDITYSDRWRPSADSNILQLCDLQDNESCRYYGYRQASAMKPIASAYDIMTFANYLENADRANTSFSSITIVEPSKYIEEDETTKKYVTHLLNRIVRIVVPSEDGDSELSEFQEEDEYPQSEDIGIENSSEHCDDSDNPSDAVNSLFNYILQVIPSVDGIDETLNDLEFEAIQDEQEDTDIPKKEQDIVVLEITESEWQMINNKEHCKCAEEKRRENYIRYMMSEGRVRIKPREIETAISRQSSVSTFEYRSVGSEHGKCELAESIMKFDNWEGSEIAAIEFHDQIQDDEDLIEDRSSVQQLENCSLTACAEYENQLSKEKELKTIIKLEPQTNKILDIAAATQSHDEQQGTEPSQTVEPLEIVATQQSHEEQQTAEPQQVSEVPQAIEEPQIIDPPFVDEQQGTEPSQTVEPLEIAATQQSHEEQQTAEPQQASEVPQAIEEPQIIDPPFVVEPTQQLEPNNEG